MPINASLDLAFCTREKIHLPGSIQPHGVLLVLDLASEIVLQAAGDPARLLQHTAHVIGATAQQILGTTLSHLLQGAEIDTFRHPAYLGTLASGADSNGVCVTGHKMHGSVLIELEPACGMDSAPRVLATIRTSSELVGNASGISDACRVAAREVRRLTGYDRVMIYRFEPDDSGTVIAEETDGAAISYMNHRYPASDIPSQARDLYRRNPIRVIPDVGYTPAQLVPGICPATDQPLDMSYCGLRSVSPVHIQYLKNMGVGASMSVSLLYDGKLWGLIACHNATAKLVPFGVREMCRHIAQTLSSYIKSHQEAASYGNALALQAARERVLAALEHASDPHSMLFQLLPELQKLVPSHGVAVSSKGEIAAAGHAPPPAQMRDLATWVIGKSSGDVFATECLSEHYSEARAFSTEASGLISVLLPSQPPVLIMWFRAEQVEEVEWAGNPHQPVDAEAGLLSPRRSFATWVETVRSRSQPWTPEEVEAVRSFRPRAVFLFQQQRVRELNELLRAANKHLAGLASTDALTEIANRRGFDARLEEEWARAARQSTSLAIIALDLDHYKQFNDQFGHPAGDECLKQVARVLRTGSRAADFAARVGGEEFSLLLPDTDLDGAYIAAEAIRTQIEALGILHPTSPMGVVTASLGVAAVIPKTSMRPYGAFGAADRALYEAKRRGRNQTVVANRQATIEHSPKELGFQHSSGPRQAVK